MGLSKSSVDVGDENGRWEWSVDETGRWCYVDGHDGSCQDGNFLSWISVCMVFFWLLNFEFLWLLVDGYGRYMIFFFRD